MFLREAFGARSAFVYGWIALLVMDPGITAALGIGLAQYSTAAIGGRADLVPAIAIAAIGANLFGVAGRTLLAIMVVIAVGGSLAATLLGAPRLYVAMARAELFPIALARLDPRRGSVPTSTMVQVVLASILVLVGTFNEILGYFVPCVVFFLGLSTAAILKLPRPQARPDVLETPLHPVPIALFLTLIGVLLMLFVVGQTRQTLLGAAVVALGIPVSFLVVRRRAEA